MADQTQTQTEDNGQQAPQGATGQPQGEPKKPETDWKAESRKWEARSKENAEKARLYDELEEARKSELEKANDAKAKAESEAEEAKAELKRMRAVSKVSEETGIPASLLHGATEDEMREEAESIKGYVESQNASIPADQGGGAAGGKSVTKDAIESIKDPLERVRARAQNASLYQ